MPSRPATAPLPVSATPHWLRYLIIALTVLALYSMFTGPIADADTWIHMRNGQWMLENHRLPIPDPFSWTTYLGKPVYPEEYATRDLNLKHEWLGQVIQYLEWAVGGAPGTVLFRATCVAGFCLVIGWIVWRRRGNFYLAIGATLAASTLARGVAVDRPYVMTYLLLALTMLILEDRRRLWLLPPMFVFWANLHGGYFMGWVVLGAYCGEALFERLRGKPPADERRLWGFSIGALLASALNPAIYGVIPGMFAYRQSFMQNTLREWHSPVLQELSWYTVLLFGAAIAMLSAWRRVRMADWLLFAVSATLSVMAQRNVIFIALIAPIVIATYLPKGKFTVPRAAEFAVALAIAFLAGQRIAGGHAFQLRVSSWKFPDGAVKFLKDHNVSAPMFNIYEWGGYLLWAAWPQEKTFVDGRALNESVFRDYMRIAFNSPDLDFRRLDLRSSTARELLDKYGVQVLLVQGFEYGQGSPYYVAPALAIDPQSQFQLVYQDNTAMVFMRQPPPGVQPLPREAVFTSLESQCVNVIQHEPTSPRCALYLADMYRKLNAADRARRWMEYYEQARRGVADAAAR